MNKVRAPIPLWQKILVVTSVVITASMVGFMGFKVLTYFTGPIVGDTWTCSKGEAPVITDMAGSACFPKDAELPPGFSWDPLGNRPSECENRYGWEPLENDKGEQTCFKRTDPLTLPPSGWHYKNFTITT